MRASAPVFVALSAALVAGHMSGCTNASPFDSAYYVVQEQELRDDIRVVVGAQKAYEGAQSIRFAVLDSEGTIADGVLGFAEKNPMHMRFGCVQDKDHRFLGIYESGAPSAILALVDVRRRQGYGFSAIGYADEKSDAGWAAIVKALNATGELQDAYFIHTHDGNHMIGGMEDRSVGEARTRHRRSLGDRTNGSFVGSTSLSSP
jgi:hypothetical protein